MKLLDPHSAPMRFAGFERAGAEFLEVRPLQDGVGVCWRLNLAPHPQGPVPELVLGIRDR